MVDCITPEDRYQDGIKLAEPVNQISKVNRCVRRCAKKPAQLLGYALEVLIAGIGIL